MYIHLLGMSDRMICNRLVEGISQGKTDEGSYHCWSLGLSVEDCGTYKEKKGQFIKESYNLKTNVT